MSIAFNSANAEIGVTDNEILLGQSVVLTGPLGDIGADLVRGARSYFDAVNEKGGIHGRKIRLVTLDDGYQVANTVKNVQRLLDEDKVFALFTVGSTPANIAIFPLTEKRPVPMFAPFSGAKALRDPVRPNLFHVRASYSDEMEKLVEHLTTIGVKRIAVAYLNNAFGKDGLEGVERAMLKRQLKLASAVSLESNGSDIQQAVQVLDKTEPQAVIMVTAGSSSADFIRAYLGVRRGVQFYSTSVLATQSTIKNLGEHGVGLVIATVVPFPWSQSSPLAKEYQATMRKSGHSEFSFISFEGFINAKVLCDALRAAGRDLTGSKFIATAEKLQVSYNGFNVKYGPGRREGSKFVDLTIIGPQGKFIR